MMGFPCVALHPIYGVRGLGSTRRDGKRNTKENENGMLTFYTLYEDGVD